MMSALAIRLTPACALCAGLLLSACADNTSAPDNGEQGKTTATVQLPPAPPPLSGATLAALGTPNGSSPSRSNASVSLSVGLATSSAALALQVGGQGVWCSPGRLDLQMPRPIGTQNLVQSFEWVWWYPVLLRWDGKQWGQVGGSFGWAYTQLPSSNPRWTLYQSRTQLNGAWTGLVPQGSEYAVVSWIYFEGSKQWAAQVETTHLNSPVAQGATTGQWCHA